MHGAQMYFHDQEYFQKSDHDDHDRHQSLEGKTSETFHQETCEKEPPHDHEEFDSRRSNLM